MFGELFRSIGIEELHELFQSKNVRQMYLRDAMLEISVDQYQSTYRYLQHISICVYIPEFQIFFSFSFWIFVRVSRFQWFISGTSYNQRQTSLAVPFHFIFVKVPYEQSFIYCRCLSLYIQYNAQFKNKNHYKKKKGIWLCKNIKW